MPKLISRKLVLAKIYLFKAWDMVSENQKELKTYM